MKYTYLLLFFLFCSFKTFSQGVFKSPKYPYVFNYQEGWYVKDKIYLSETDAKVVDGKGNSFIVSVKTLPLDLRNISSLSILKNVTNKELADFLGATYDDIIISKRGVVNLDGKDFYYFHASVPFTGNQRLVHKMFMYNYKAHAYTIDCASLSSMTNETSIFFDLMLHTFKFL